MSRGLFAESWKTSQLLGSVKDLLWHHASLVQRWPFNKNILNWDPSGTIHYCFNTSSSALVESRNCGSPQRRPAHYCPCEQLVWFIKHCPHCGLERPKKSKEQGAVGGREHDGRLWFSPGVPEVKYDWLVRSWVDMPSLQLKPVNSMCKDWAEGRIKPVVTATWQILWLAGQATVQER